MTTPESKVKAYLREQVKARGWRCYVLENPVDRGWPDRMITAPGGFIAFVELKAEEVKHNKAHLRRQLEVRDELCSHGIRARSATGKSGVRELIDELVGLGWP